MNSIIDSILYQCDVMFEKEKAMQYNRKKGIVEAAKAYRIYLSQDVITELVGGKVDEDYVPDKFFVDLVDYEQYIGARDVFTSSRKESGDDRRIFGGILPYR